MAKEKRKYWNVYSHAFAVALLAVTAYVAILPITSVEWFQTHEMLAPVERVIALAHEVQHGDFYPRWVSAAYHGHGVPFFNYYSPAFYLLSAYLCALGFPLVMAMKLVIFGCIFVGSFGMYLWLYHRRCGTGALVAAIIYMFLPYHFVVLYVRGAFAEFTALSLFPFLFLGIELMFSRRPFLGIVVTALSSAGIVLSHNLSLMMVAPFAGLFWIYIAVQNRATLQRAVLALGGPILGCLLSAFYWLPVFAERNYIPPLKKVMTSSYYQVAYHFVYFQQWFDSKWGFGGSMPKIARDDMSFQLGWILCFCIIVSLFSFIRGDNRQRNFGVVTLVLGILSLLMTHSLSNGVYESIGVLKFVQFPWRFLGTATFFLAAFCGLSGTLCDRKWYHVLLVILVIFSSIFLSTGQRVINKEMSLDDEMAERMVVNRELTGLASLNEYLPVWAKGVVLDLVPVPYNKSMTIRDLVIEASSMSFTFQGTHDVGKVMIPWHYYPGWVASVDGSSVPVELDPSGFVQLTVPPGQHQVNLKFGTTRVRIIAWLLSCVGVSILVGGLLKTSGLIVGPVRD